MRLRNRLSLILHRRFGLESNSSALEMSQREKHAGRHLSLVLYEVQRLKSCCCYLLADERRESTMLDDRTSPHFTLPTALALT